MSGGTEAAANCGWVATRCGRMDATGGCELDAATSELVGSKSCVLNSAGGFEAAAI
jgi:hypothetical protein